MRERLFIHGVNHVTTAVGLRERLAFAQPEVPAALARLKLAAPALNEVALLSTCNRVEIIGVSEAPVGAAEEATEFFANDRQIALHSLKTAFYHHQGADAVRHLFRVGASLDSMIVGEPQILGQLKEAYAQAAEAGTAGLVLHRAFHKAFAVAKRVRKSTLIGYGAVSVSSAAVNLAGKIFDTLTDKTIMLIGAGKMAALAARSLKRLGVESLLITSRTFDHAVALARDLGGTAVPWESHKAYLKLADIVIGSLASTRPVISREEFEVAIKERRYRPMFLIDLGVPRNFDERLNALENVYLYDIDDLGKVVQENRGERSREALRAETIIELEVDAFLKWLGELDLVPAIKQIRSSVEQLRELELGRHRAWLDSLEPGERARIESLTRGMINKLLHRILAGLRDGRANVADGLQAAEIAQRLLSGELTPANHSLDDLDREDD